MTRDATASTTPRPRTRQCGRWVSLACIVLLASTSCEPELTPRGTRTPTADATR